MHPKFEVGEVIILQSKDMPHLNGEYVVDALSVGELGDKVDYKGYLFRHTNSTVAYFLEGVCNDRGVPIFFRESALRKKYLPGELSFTDLMASLSSPKLITHQA